MSRLIMWNLVTLDGYFQGSASWDLGWHQSVWGEELERLSLEQLRSADGLVFGRITYEGMAAHWSAASGEVAELMNALPKHVFSRTLAEADWSNSRLVKEDAAAAVPRLKAGGVGELLVFGSANLSSTLIAEGLFDEYRLAICPVALGEGKPLFGEVGTRKRLELLGSPRTLASGCVILRYAEARDAGGGPELASAGTEGR